MCFDWRWWRSNPCVINPAQTLCRSTTPFLVSIFKTVRNVIFSKLGKNFLSMSIWRGDQQNLVKEDNWGANRVQKSHPSVSVLGIFSTGDVLDVGDVFVTGDVFRCFSMLVFQFVTRFFPVFSQFGGKRKWAIFARWKTEIQRFAPREKW